jgi:hypothetical protein
MIAWSQFLTRDLTDGPEHSRIVQDQSAVANTLFAG